MLRVLNAVRPVRAGLRRLSTAALPDEPPIKMYGIAGRYANALYTAAAKKSELLQVEQDLKLFKETTTTSAVVRNFVLDPSISRTAKVEGMMKLCADANACESTKNVLGALAEGGRMGEVFKVVDLYSDLLTAAKGEVNAVITSAKPLQQKEVDEIMSALGQLSGQTSKISVQTEVDPSLIAGVTIEFGDKYIDLSVGSQLKRLQGLLQA